VQRRRDAAAAKCLFKRLLKGLQYVPHVLVTDKQKLIAEGQCWQCRSNDHEVL
jgi:transposase-like protein